MGSKASCLSSQGYRPSGPVPCGVSHRVSHASPCLQGDRRCMLVSSGMRLARAHALPRPPPASCLEVSMRALLTALLASLALAAAVTTASAFTVINNGTISYRIDGVD